MINLWDYAEMLPRIQLITKDGSIYVGDTVIVYDADEIECAEDCIALEIEDGQIKHFFPSQIASIEIVE